MNQKNIFILIIVLLVLGTIATVLIRSKGPVVVSTKYDIFAKCVASKNLTMYGAAWCSHCQAQKALFGDSFSYVPYVECTEKPDECLAKGVESYPTWIDTNGTKYLGEQSLERISEITSCELPI